MSEKDFQAAMEVIEVDFSGSISNFWDALIIYYKRPNSINKQIIFSEHVFGAKFKSSLALIECFKLYNELSTYLIKGLNIYDNLKNEGIVEFIDMEHLETAFMDTNEMYLLIRKLIPKTDCGGDIFYEYFFLDKQLTRAFIRTQHIREDALNINSNSTEVVRRDPLFVLKFKEIDLVYNGDSIRLSYTRDLGDKGINWLKEIFIKKFIKIMRNASNEINRNKNSDSLQFSSKVNIVQYYKHYEQMKLKYAKSLIENWSENTDPQKFVFEDIGIATYLMLLWNNGNIPEQLSEEKKVKFVDLGCGNGLLVHILNSEGHLGVGLDIRKRKIWDTYPPTTLLREETVNPTTETIYPDADWLIGNHSDELTAWIPIMARKSNKCCQYFVLPCCPFQLNGEKFQRRNSGLSSYMDFINYVKDISELCEFETYIDKLRIPSTKRVCLIGLTQSDMSEEKYNSINMKILNFVQAEFKQLNNNLKRKIGETEKEEATANDASLNFKVRESKEKIRNCTKLHQGLVNTILKAVTESLLKHNSPYIVEKNNSTFVWNRGGKLSISELAKGIDGELLKQLKVQCKGLQTLLKNHHYVFDVSNGYAQFRSPNELLEIVTKLLKKGDKLKWKKRSCWFYNNHPDKCPLSDDVCSYSHED